MLTNLVVAIVEFCRRNAWFVAAFMLALSVGLGWFTATHFRINTDLNTLLAEDLPWRQREKDLEAAFPQRQDLLVVVLDGQSAAQADQAAARLADRMRAEPQIFRSVQRPDALLFFRQNGLLYMDHAALTATLQQMTEAQPMLAALAADPSLRGLFHALSLVLEGVARGESGVAAKFNPVLAAITQAMQASLAGEQAGIDWQKLMNGGAQPSGRDLRRFILAQPVLNFSALSPGAEATKTVRRLAQELNLTPNQGLRVRLTGSVALNDEEFASVAEGTGLATLASGLLVLILLFAALRSFRIVLPILITLSAGLIATTAFALAAIGSLNLISVAFAVMFVGIAVDFGIQFGVRFRDQYHKDGSMETAMPSTARILAVPLTLASICTAVGFLSFTPTDYAGVAELGLIAGAGMIIALILNLTLLPALIRLFNPPPEPEHVGFIWAGPLDAFLLRRRKAVMAAAALLALVGLALTTQLRFDFDPLNLKDPDTESVATLFDLMKQPESTPYTIDILAPDLPAAVALAARIAKLPEVDRVMTLESFIPDNQDEKLALIGDAAMLLLPTLEPSTVAPAPDDAAVRASLQDFAAKLAQVEAQLPAAPALRTAVEKILGTDDPALYPKLHQVLLDGMLHQLAMIRILLNAQPVTLNDIPLELKADWMTTDGRARLEVYPKGDAHQRAVMLAFTKAVRQIAPTATGMPISIQESADTIVSAFIKAAGLALAAIALLLALTLRRLFDVVALMAPLTLAGILTLGTSVALGIPVNFANIIALPLLLGLGVSFAIYFVVYWREGGTTPLQSSMARAVVFSAFTTAVAFGSLSLSSHPGTASMGKILTTALVYTLVSTWFLLPALLGRPNAVKGGVE